MAPRLVIYAGVGLEAINKSGQHLQPRYAQTPVKSRRIDESALTHVGTGYLPPRSPLPKRSMSSLMSSTLQAVVRGPSFTGLG